MTYINIIMCLLSSVLINGSIFSQNNVQVVKSDGNILVEKKIKSFIERLSLDSCYYGSICVFKSDTIVSLKPINKVNRKKIEAIEAKSDSLVGSYFFLSDEIQKFPTCNKGNDFYVLAHFFLMKSKLIIFYDDYFSIDRKKDSIETNLNELSLNVILDLLELSKK